MTTAGTTDTATRPGVRRQRVQVAAMVLGAVLLLIGVLGFVPGITSITQLQFAGRHSNALLLGTFEVSALHNLLHLGLGIAGLVMSRVARQARVFLIGGGVVLAVLWLYGMLISLDGPANFIPVNDPDNWLHLALAVVMIALGILLGRDVTRPRDHGSGPPVALPDRRGCRAWR